MYPHQMCICLISICLVLALLTGQGAAYDNALAHPEINKAAIVQFEADEMHTDPYLKNTTLNGSPVYGYAWDPVDGKENTGPRDMKSEYRQKNLRDWIIDGGYSADEPEVTMALVHFYDPTNKNEPWLTDKRWLQNKFVEGIARLSTSGDFKIPDLSAMHWTFDAGGYGAGGEVSDYFIQDYSWDDGLAYYKQALQSKDKNNPYYGQAWRAVGETMHMISDMTVPAHVRNDGHITIPFPSPGFLSDPDPYESAVGAEEVKRYASGEQNKTGHAVPLTYDSGDLRELMHTIALFTNEHFLTADTSPYSAYALGSSDLKITGSYPKPEVNACIVNEDGYCLERINGAVVRLAKKTEHLSGLGIEAPIGKAWYSFDVDDEVLQDQRSILVPTAIRASDEVLDRFLPRFEAILDVKRDLKNHPEEDLYEVHARLVQKRIQPDAWKDYPDLRVRNGAYLVEITPDGKEKETPLSLIPARLDKPADPDFNDWKDLFTFSAGTRLSLKYDLGGYVIRSNDYVVPKPETGKRTPEPTETPGDDCNSFSWDKGEFIHYTMLHGGYGIYVDKGWIDRPEFVFEFTAPSSGMIRPSYNRYTGGTIPLDDAMEINGKKKEISNSPVCVEKGEKIRVTIAPGYLTPYKTESKPDEYGNNHIYEYYTCNTTSGELCFDFDPDGCTPSLSPTPTQKETPRETNAATPNPTPGTRPSGHVTPVPSPKTTSLPDIGDIFIESEPSGAEVSIDGMMRGKTPLTIRDAPAGTHSLELVIYTEDRAGIIWSGSTEVTLEPFTTLPVMVSLTPKRTETITPTPVPTPSPRMTVQTTTPPPVQTQETKTPSGTKPPTDEPTPFSPGPSRTPEIGDIFIESDPPGAEVRMDGVMRGTTPFTIRDVPAGAHSLELAIYTEDHAGIIWSGFEEVILEPYTTLQVMVTLTQPLP